MASADPPSQRNVCEKKGLGGPELDPPLSLLHHTHVSSPLSLSMLGPRCSMQNLSPQKILNSIGITAAQKDIGIKNDVTVYSSRLFFWLEPAREPQVVTK